MNMHIYEYIWKMVYEHQYTERDASVVLYIGHGCMVKGPSPTSSCIQHSLQWGNGNGISI